MDETDPYRDDRPSRVAETQRPRRSPSGSRRRRSLMGIGVGVVILIGIDFEAFNLVRAWVNGTRDLYPLLAFGLLGVLIMAHIGIALRAFARTD